MPSRDKRSVSLPPELAAAVDAAAQHAGTTFSAWLADAAAHRLRMVAGEAALAEWEAANGPLTGEERSQGRARARRSLNRPAAERRPA